MKQILLAAICIAFFSCGQKKNKITGDHSKFEDYWQDFKKAVLANDKETVFALTNMPFIDAGAEREKKRGRVEEPVFTSNNHKEFLAKYDILFNAGVIDAIKNDKYLNQASYNEDHGDSIDEGWYVLDAHTPIKGRGDQELLFKKIDGKYKLFEVWFLG